MKSKIMPSWDCFNAKYPTEELQRARFEDLARCLFCRRYNIRYGIKQCVNHAINAIMAYAIILIAQYGYRNDMWSETVGKIIHLDKEPAWNLEDLYIKTINGRRPVSFSFQGEIEKIQ
ncbi:MAG: hypothetical protein J6Y78_10000 [Paludibacteraceae bacterium]|nr:hypothetical protein [Paludibacteraceae bacterium]